MDYSELESHYRAYVDTYRDGGGALPPMMELKLAHTMAVVSNARLIAGGERFASREAAVSEAAALLHDTGRYEQLKRYGTFRDSDSADHAELSWSIVKERGWLNALCAEDRDAALAAIRFHNKRELPPGLSVFAGTCAHAVRDADKLDIFRVLEDRVANTDWRRDSTAFWGLRPAERPSGGVVAAIIEGRPVDYNLIASLADFVAIQVGWMVSGLHFATTRRIGRERRHLEFREKFLREITGPSGEADVAAVCAKARDALAV